MYYQQVEDHLFKLYTSGLRYTTLLSGPPGIAKSACVKSLAARIAETAGHDFIDLTGRNDNNLTEYEFGFRAIPMTVVDPLDFGGVVGIFDSGNGPYATRVSLQDMIPRQGRGILLYDDLPTAPPLTQAAAYRTIWERDLIGPDWMIVATGNRSEDRAATNRMPTPLVSKMMWLNFEPHLESWQRLMATKDGAISVRAFLQSAPDRFVTFDPSIPGPFATARTWEMLSDLCRVYAPSIPPIEAITGCVGSGVDLEFEAFAQMAASLVNPDDVLADPARAPVPEEPGPLYVVTTALAGRADANNFATILRYLDRLPPEYAIYCVKACLVQEAGKIKALGAAAGRFRRIDETSAFIDCAVRYQDLLV